MPTTIAAVWKLKIALLNLAAEVYRSVGWQSVARALDLRVEKQQLELEEYLRGFDET